MRIIIIILIVGLFFGCISNSSFKDKVNFCKEKVNYYSYNNCDALFEGMLNPMSTACGFAATITGDQNYKGKQPYDICGNYEKQLKKQMDEYRTCLDKQTLQETDKEKKLDECLKQY